MSPYKTVPNAQGHELGKIPFSFQKYPTTCYIVKPKNDYLQLFISNENYIFTILTLEKSGGVNLVKKSNIYPETIAILESRGRFCRIILQPASIKVSFRQ
jgi:hypothetical protein